MAYTPCDDAVRASEAVPEDAREYAAPLTVGQSSDPDGLYRQTFQDLPLSMALLDADGRIVDVNASWRAFASANGGDPGGYIGMNYIAACRDPSEPCAVEVERLFNELLAGHRDQVTLEYPCHSPDERRWFLMQADRYWHGDSARIAVLHLDITDRRLAEETAREQAATDGLTGLLNRQAFMDRAQPILAIAEREALDVAIVFLDLDNYKAINDTHGHEVGDRVLTTIADRLRRQTRGSDLLARYGGDELIVIAEGADRDNAQYLAERLAGVITTPVTIDGTSFRMTCSQGIAVYPDHGRDLTTLIAAADAAMYQAKQAGRNRVVIAS